MVNNAAIENATRVSQTDENLRRRVEQLISIARVSRELNSMVDLKPLLEAVRDESMRTTVRSAERFCSSIQPFPPVLLRDHVTGLAYPGHFRLDQQVIETGDPQLISDYSFLDETPSMMVCVRL